MRGLRAEQCGAAPGPGHKCSSQSSRRADGRGARPANREKSDFLTGSDEGVAADTDAKADASEEGAVGKWQAVQPDKEQKLDRAGGAGQGVQEPGGMEGERLRASFSATQGLSTSVNRQVRSQQAGGQGRALL